MSSLPELRVDWCSHAAARYACEKWHYSRRMPLGRLNMLGVWEGGTFIGAVVFAHGAAPKLGARYGLNQFQICELARVALHRHRWPVSRILAIAIRLLERHSPGLRLLISFADPAEGHI